MITMGIDPGRHGAIVALDWPDDGGPIIYMAARADGPRGYYSAPARTAIRPDEAIYALMPVLPVVRGEVRAFVEAPAWHAGGGRRMNAGDAGRLGIEHGVWRAVLASHGIDWRVVRAQVWRSIVRARKIDGSTKAGSIAVCRRRLPLLDLTPGRLRVPHDGLADAACMALAAHDGWPDDA